MTDAEMLALILGMPGAEASSHFGTPDFRVRKKIFATHRGPGLFVIKLTREQQEMLVDAEGDVFRPLPNKWGLQGWTAAHIATLDPDGARSALRMAWANVAPKSLQKS
jgi:hypothetical protein